MATKIRFDTDTKDMRSTLSLLQTQEHHGVWVNLLKKYVQP